MSLLKTGGSCPVIRGFLVVWRGLFETPGVTKAGGCPAVADTPCARRAQPVRWGSTAARLLAAYAPLCRPTKLALVYDMRKDERFASVLAPIAVVFMLLTSSGATVEALLAGTCFEPMLSWLLNLQKIFFSLSSGCFSGLVIWLFLVDFPYRQKRRAAKASTRMRYSLFRESVTNIFLDAAGEAWGLDLIEQLRAPSDFRKYFDKVGADGQTKRIAVVQTVLSRDKPDLLDQLITELRLLAEEFRLALYTLDIADPELLDDYKQFIAAQHDLRYPDSVSPDLLDYHFKPVFQNVYGIMASRSSVEGCMDTDFVAEMIKKL